MGSIHGQLSKYTGIHCVFQQHSLISHDRSSLRHVFIHVTLSGSFAVKFTFLPFHKFKCYISRFVHASRVSYLIYTLKIKIALNANKLSTACNVNCAEHIQFNTCNQITMNINIFYPEALLTQMLHVL